jgi:hypothetical protein
VLDSARRFYRISTRPVEVSVEVSAAAEPAEPPGSLAKARLHVIDCEAEKVTEHDLAQVS